MQVLNFSGAATKAAALASHGRIILNKEGYRPRIITGVSSGALVILPMLLQKHSALEKYTTSLTLESIFDKVPVNDEGKVTPIAALRAISSGSLGSMNNLVKMLTEIVTESEYNKLMSHLGTPSCYVGVTNATKDKFEMVKLNDISYQNAIEFILASCSIPIFCPPIKIGNYYYYDGGVKNHICSTTILNKHRGKISKSISVYSRPLNDTGIDWGFNGKYLGRNIIKTFDMMQRQISEHNQEAESDLAKLYRVNLDQRFSPKVMKGLYDVDNARLRKLYDEIIISKGRSGLL